MLSGVQGLISIERFRSAIGICKWFDRWTVMSSNRFFLERGIYRVGEILNSDWLKSYIYFPYMPTQPISKNVKKEEIL